MVLCKPYNAQKQISAESKDGVGQESGTTTLLFIFVSLYANYCLLVDFYQVGQITIFPSISALPSSS